MSAETPITVPGRNPIPQVDAEALGRRLARALLRGDIYIAQATNWGKPANFVQVVFRGSVDFTPTDFEQIQALQEYQR